MNARKVIMSPPFIAGSLFMAGLGTYNLTNTNFDPSLNSVHPLVAEADTDGTGVLDLEENFKLLSRFDKNGDGLLSKEELAEADKVFQNVNGLNNHRNINESQRNFWLAKRMILESQQSAAFKNYLERRKK